MSHSLSNFLILAIMVGLAVVVLGWLQRSTDPPSTSLLENLARALQLDWQKPRWFGSAGNAAGTIAGARVRITVGGNGTLAVSVDAGPPEGALIATHGLADSSATHPTGDDLFDRNVIVRGESPAPEAILSHPIRQRILAMREHATFTAQSGHTHATFSSEGEVSDAAARVREIVELSLALARRPSSAAAVAENVAVEPDSSVRERNFEALLACGDPASIEKGTNAALRDWRLKAIARCLMPSAHAELLAEPFSESVDRIANTSESLQVRAIDALRTAGVAAQPLLIALLHGTKSGLVEIALLHALAESGDVSAIPVLRARYGTTRDTPADRTILAIQARAGGSPGGVTLAEDSERGAISLARDGGALSMAKGPKG